MDTLCLWLHQHTESLSLCCLFHPLFLFCVWWQVINHMLICGLYLLSLSLSPPSIHTQFPYTQKINFPPIRKKKKNSFPPSIVFIDSCGVGAVARWCTFLCVKSTAFDICIYIQRGEVVYTVPVCVVLCCCCSWDVWHKRKRTPTFLLGEYIVRKKKRKIDERWEIPPAELWKLAEVPMWATVAHVSHTHDSIPFDYSILF